MSSAYPLPGSNSDAPEPMFSLVLDQPDARYIHEFEDAHKTFRIRCADTEGHRSSVSMLVDKMYSWREYESYVLVARIRVFVPPRTRPEPDRSRHFRPGTRC